MTQATDSDETDALYLLGEGRRREKGTERKLADQEKFSIGGGWNIWKRISDLILHATRLDEVEEAAELSVAKASAGILEVKQAETAQHSYGSRLHVRFALGGLLLCELVFALFLYNQVLLHYTGRKLTVPETMARPFAGELGPLLRDQHNQIWLYLMYALWLAIAL